MDIKLIWKGKGLSEVVYDARSKKTIIRIDKKHFRETEVDDLIGNYAKAKRILKWKPRTSVNQLVKEMVNVDLELELNS